MWRRVGSGQVNESRAACSCKSQRLSGCYERLQKLNGRGLCLPDHSRCACVIAAGGGSTPGVYEVSDGGGLSAQRRAWREKLRRQAAQMYFPDAASPSGPGSAEATTNRPATSAWAGAATATRTSSPSWQSLPGGGPARAVPQIPGPPAIDDIRRLPQHCGQEPSRPRRGPCHLGHYPVGPGHRNPCHELDVGYFDRRWTPDEKPAV